METKNNVLDAASLPKAKETYKAPFIEIVEIKVEHGFECSLSCDPYDDEATF